MRNNPINLWDILGNNPPNPGPVVPLPAVGVSASRIYNDDLLDLYVDGGRSNPFILALETGIKNSGKSPGELAKEEAEKKKKEDCDKLAALLSQAQSTESRYNGYFSKTGEYGAFASVLGAVDPNDITSLLSALTSLGAGARAQFLLNTIDRTGVSLDFGATFYPNRASPWSKLAAVGSVVGAGSDGFSLGDHLANGEWSSVPLDVANIGLDFYTLAAFTPGVGIGIAIGQLGVNATLAREKFNAALEDIGNAFQSAATAKVTQQAAASKAADLKQQMTAKGCN